MKEYSESYAFFDELFEELFPILRSITGPGLRESYDIFSKYMPLERLSIKSGTKVFDWTVPQEWHCKEAYLISPSGETIADVKRSNLEVLNYSEPVDMVISKNDLIPHLYSLPNMPEAIPYVTSYYQKRWGFCLKDSVKNSLEEGDYRAVIDSKFVDGTLDISQTILPGDSEKEVLLSSYLCHPSMANNELSGPLVLLGLYHRIKNWKNRRYTYRFILNPETIGSLGVLSLLGDELREKLISGLVINCMGGEQEELTFKHSRNDSSMLDKLLYHLNKHNHGHDNIPFSPLGGSDERQYNSPGFQLPVCCVSRSFHVGYKEYHTSLDTKEYMGIDKILDSIDKLENIFYELDCSAKFENLSPHGEPNLGSRGLYPTLSFYTGERSKQLEELDNIRMLLNYSDGDYDSVDIANIHGCSVGSMRSAIEKLENNNLLKMY